MRKMMFRATCFLFFACVAAGIGALPCCGGVTDAGQAAPAVGGAGPGRPSMGLPAADGNGILLAARTGNVLPRFRLVARITRGGTSVSEEYFTVNAPSAGEARKMAKEKIRDKYPDARSIRFVRSQKLD